MVNGEPAPHRVVLSPGALFEEIDELTRAGVEVVVLGPDDSKHGAVETRADAKRCAELFQQRRGEIDGIIVSGSTSTIIACTPLAVLPRSGP